MLRAGDLVTRTIKTAHFVGNERFFSIFCSGFRFLCNRSSFWGQGRRVHPTDFAWEGYRMKFEWLMVWRRLPEVIR